MSKVEKFHYNFYAGRVYCCKCHKRLGKAIVFGMEGDDEGYYWRSFCPECAPSGDPEEVYRMYPVSDYE